MHGLLLLKTVLIRAQLVTLALGDDVQAVWGFDFLPHIVGHFASAHSALHHGQTILSIGNDKIVGEANQFAVLAEV